MLPAESRPIEPDLDYASEGSPHMPEILIQSKSVRAGGARPHVVVIGAGVCGLGIAWRLAQAGCAVDIFERGEAGHGATWAAAGMLAAGAEAEPGEQRLLELTRLSLAAWPAFAEEVEVVPEPMTLMLLGGGSLILVWRRRRS